MLTGVRLGVYDIQVEGLKDPFDSTDAQKEVVDRLIFRQ